MKSRYHERIGAKGGAVKSAAKAAAARTNGKRGGRPRKEPDSALRNAAAFVLNNGGNVAEACRRFGVYRRRLEALINSARSSAE